MIYYFSYNKNTLYNVGTQISNFNTYLIYWNYKKISLDLCFFFLEILQCIERYYCTVSARYISIGPYILNIFYFKVLELFKSLNSFFFLH